MSNEETKHKIHSALKELSAGNLTANATRLFNILGYAAKKGLTKPTFQRMNF
jgi:hypothetical protein